MLRYLTLLLLVPINTISAIEHYELYEGLDNEEIQTICHGNETYLLLDWDKMILINSDKIEHFDICRSEISSALVALEKEVKSFTFQPYAHNIENCNQILRRLHMLLIEPAEKNLRFNLKIVKTKSLMPLPWNSLLGREGKFLIEKHSISIVKKVSDRLPSFKKLEDLKVHMIAPKFDGSLALRSHEETEFMEEIWSNLNNEVNTSKIIHISSHNFIDTSSWEKSGILLANGEVLSNQELGRTDLAGSLVFLNMCSGAQVILDNRSIADAFIKAGADYVIAALWEIDDQMAVSISKSFYQSLRSGNDTSSALRESLLRYKDKMEESGQFNPIYWSAYQSYGEGFILARKPQFTVKRVASIALSLCTSFSILFYYFGGKIKSKILDYNLV